MTFGEEERNDEKEGKIKNCRHDTPKEVFLFRKLKGLYYRMQIAKEQQGIRRIKEGAKEICPRGSPVKKHEGQHREGDADQLLGKDFAYQSKPFFHRLTSFRIYYTKKNAICQSGKGGVMFF